MLSEACPDRPTDHAAMRPIPGWLRFTPRPCRYEGNALTSTAAGIGDVKMIRFIYQIRNQFGADFVLPPHTLDIAARVTVV